MFINGQKPQAVKGNFLLFLIILIAFLFMVAARSLDVKNVICAVSWSDGRAENGLRFNFTVYL